MSVLSQKLHHAADMTDAGNRASSTLLRSAAIAITEYEAIIAADDRVRAVQSRLDAKANRQAEEIKRLNAEIRTLKADKALLLRDLRGVRGN